MKDDRIRDIVRNLDSDKLREMSKNNELISDILYGGVFGIAEVAVFGPAILDAIRALRMELIFEQVSSDCEKLSEKDKEVLLGICKEEEKFPDLGNFIAFLCDRIIVGAHRRASYWSDLKKKIRKGDNNLFIKKVLWLLARLLLSAPFAGVANNLSQRFQGRSNELGVLADKIDSLNKKSIGKAHKSRKPYRGM